MSQRVRDVMTATPVVLPTSASIQDAAREMRDNDIGDVLVSDSPPNGPYGLVTDRDLVVRALAEGAAAARLADVCSRDLVTVSPDEPVERAVELMKDRAVRRVPVVDNGRAVGVLSIGDLALERDPQSALADISAASPNR